MSSAEPIPESVDESYDPSKVIVNYLPMSVTSASLKEMFAPYGTVEDANVVIDPITKMSRLFGFVKFSTKEEAEKAIEGLNGKPVDMSNPEAKPIRVAISKPPKVPVNLYVGNLIAEAKLDDLKALFSQYGAIVESNIPTDRATGLCKGFGFVRLDSKTAARKAMEGLNGHVVASLSGTAPLSVKLAENNNGGHNHNNRFGNGMDRRRFHQAPRMMPSYIPAAPMTFEGVCLFVYNIPPTMDDRGLQELFRSYGTVTGARVVRKMNRSKGYGFVNMSTQEEAQLAISGLNGRTLVPDRPLQVSLKKDDKI
jgi:RNA recognition motif-containing protein